MKVVIENIVAACRLAGNLDLEKISSDIEGSRYQPDLFKGIILNRTEPNADIFILDNGTLKFHGLTSEEKLKASMRNLLNDLKEIGIDTMIAEPLRITEVVASFSLGGRIDPKEVYEEFKQDGVIYDPAELPGFILGVGKSGIELLIFPEGKVISRGADNILDAVSSLQMVEARIKVPE